MIIIINLNYCSVLDKSNGELYSNVCTHWNTYYAWGLILLHDGILDHCWVVVHAIFFFSVSFSSNRKTLLGLTTLHRINGT